jgi:NAD(P)-dependent dehydrogenase (short-subunit alcohol dehydrogenase family)
VSRPVDHAGHAGLAGRTALITGANQGLGLQIARSYVEAGASVMLCARDGERLDRARTEVASLAGREQRVLAHRADISRADEATGLVAATLAQFSELHVLVNNAGVYGPMGSIEEVDWASWVKAIEVNLFGSVLMCRAVLPHFKAHRHGKIIQLSGGGATSPMPRISAYAASKAAVVRFAETVAEEVREDGIDVNAIAPGGLNTRMLDEVLAAGPDRTGQKFYDQMLKQKAQGGAPLERGAALAVFLGSRASDGISGKLFSAIWDPWETFDEHIDDLRNTDVYTLRRIVPADRGLHWGKK